MAYLVRRAAIRWDYRQLIPWLRGGQFKSAKLQAEHPQRLGHNLDLQFPHAVVSSAEELAVEMDVERYRARESDAAATALAHQGVMLRRTEQG
jgi:hypothetical protein